MNVLALIGYAAFPLMPPRLLNDCDTKFGGCQPGFEFVDTMDVYGGLWSWRNSSIAKVRVQSLIRSCVIPHHCLASPCMCGG
jgi:hypothetical protein